MEHKVGEVVTLKGVIIEVDAHDPALPLLIKVEGGQYPFWLSDTAVQEVVGMTEVEAVAEDADDGCWCSDDEE